MATTGKGTYTRVTLSGPFFDGDPEKVFGKNVQAMLEDAVSEQSSEVERLIQGRADSMRFYTGRSARAVRGRVKSIGGKQWHYHAVVSADTAGLGRADAIRIRASSASIERRWHPYRRVASASRKIRRNLTEGLE